jgi:hypothetical protein
MDFRLDHCYAATLSRLGRQRHVSQRKWFTSRAISFSDGCYQNQPVDWPELARFIAQTTCATPLFGPRAIDFPSQAVELRRSPTCAGAMKRFMGERIDFLSAEQLSVDCWYGDGGTPSIDRERGVG